MGRFIHYRDLPDDNRWIIPTEFLKYDRRFQPEPWPNTLFPFYLDWHWGADWWSLEKKLDRIRLRRFVEQKCQGDVFYTHLTESVLPENQCDRLYFEHEGDQVLTKLTFSEYLKP